jgi:hypothetical protein
MTISKGADCAAARESISREKSIIRRADFHHRNAGWLMDSLRV